MYRFVFIWVAFTDVVNVSSIRRQKSAVVDERGRETNMGGPMTDAMDGTVNEFVTRTADADDTNEGDMPKLMHEEEEDTLPCRSLSALHPSNASGGAAATLEEWCGNITLQTEGSAWKSCLICWDSETAELTESSMYLHWKARKNLHAGRGGLAALLAPKSPPKVDMKFGSRHAMDHDDESCATWSVSGSTSHLDVIGAYGKKVKGVCSEVSMRDVNGLLLGVLHALGVEHMGASDQSYFGACKSTLSMPLKAATKGRTVYQAWYGDAFNFDGAGIDCNSVIQNVFTFARDSGLVEAAENILALTRSQGPKCTADVEEMYRRFRQELLPAMNKSAESSCTEFIVDVPRAFELLSVHNKR